MIKEMMIKGMDKIMLDCEQATYLITKSEMEDIGCIKKIQLKMHLAGCKFCSRFKIQSDLIDQSLRTLEHIKLHEEDKNSALKLRDEKKEEIQKVIIDSK
jgi:hypothetical protein